MADFILGRLKFKWKGDWVTATQYIIDDIIKYGGNTYVCIVNHVADALFYTDLDSNGYWSLHTESFSYNTSSTAWAQTTAYRLNDVVRWGSNLYICNAHHTSATEWSTNSGKFTLFVPGLEFEDSYSDATQYQVGDVVTYGGYSYTAKQDTKANIPTNTTFWDLLTTGFKVIGEYSSGVEYTPGNVVTQSGYVYVSKVVTTGNAPTIEDGVTGSPTLGQTITNADYWDLLNTGFKFRSDWQDSIIYYLGDTVKYSNSSYVCIIEHTGDGNLTHRPPNATYWDMLSAGESTLTMTQPGDIMIRTATNVNLPMGLKGWKLRSDEGQSHPIHWDPDDRSYTWHVDPYKGEDIEELVYTPGVSVISDYSSSQTYTAGSVCRWAPPIWVTGTTYAVGGIVSYTDTTATAGERIKWYKCIDATNASTAPSTGGTVSAPWKATSPSTTITQTTATDPNGASVFYGKDRLYGENDSSVTTNYNTSEIMYKVYIAVKERKGLYLQTVH